MRVLIIGGTSFMGPHVVTGLTAHGHEVLLLHRGKTTCDLPAGAREMHCPDRSIADRSYYADLTPQFREFAPEVVLDMIPMTEAAARTVMETFRGIARRVVAASSQDVYRAYGIILGREKGPPDPVPLREDASLRENHYPYRGADPRAADDPHRWMDEYDKILVERTFLSDRTLPGTILRLPMVYGPRDRQHRIFEYLKRMQDGRAAILLDETIAGWRWTRGYVEDMAAAITLAIVDDRATGRIYNIGETDALPIREWVAEIGHAAGWDGEVVALPAESLPEAMRASINVTQDLVTDSTRIRAELGYQETQTRADAIARTIDWERTHPPEKYDEKMFNYAAEDVALAAYRAGEE